MRRLVPAVLLLAAIGCGTSELYTTRRTAGAPKAGEPPDVAFDTSSATNTLAWAARIWRGVDRAPKGSVPALLDARNEARAQLREGAKGKSIRWMMTVKEIDAEGRCVLQPLSTPDPTPDPHNGWSRFYTLSVGFGDAPPKPDWINTVASGSPVLVIGKVTRAVSDQSQAGNNEWNCALGLTLFDARLEKP